MLLQSWHRWFCCRIQIFRLGRYSSFIYKLSANISTGLDSCLTSASDHSVQSSRPSSHRSCCQLLQTECDGRNLLWTIVVRVVNDAKVKQRAGKQYNILICLRSRYYYQTYHLLILLTVPLWHFLAHIWFIALLSWDSFRSLMPNAHDTVYKFLVPEVRLVAWHSGRTSVFDRRTFLRLTCSWRWPLMWVNRPL